MAVEKCEDPACPMHEVEHSHIVLPQIERTSPMYLGDGVYASWDRENQQVWLSVNDHEAVPVIAIDLDVMDQLNEYVNRMRGVKS